jgi:hypothetical protein
MLIWGILNAYSWCRIRKPGGLEIGGAHMFRQAVIFAVILSVAGCGKGKRDSLPVATPGGCPEFCVNGF